MAGCTDCPSENVNAENLTDSVFRRVLWVALLSNFVMFGVEMGASWYSESMALQADALDFFGDAANYGISLFVLGMALRYRSYAALFKSLTMAAFGLWVIVSAVERSIYGSVPEPITMGSIAVLALVVNVGVAILLYRYRAGDSNTRSIWLCSRNDAIGNVAVMLAAAGVFTLSSRWPDLLVATLIASLSLSAAAQVIRQAVVELRSGAVSDCEPSSPSMVENRL